MNCAVSSGWELAALTKSGWNKMREHLPAFVVNLAKLRRLRVVERGFEEFERIGGFILLKQSIRLIYYAVLGRTRQGEGTENGQRKQFLHSC